MFWERFYKLCKDTGTTPSAVTKAIGISHAATTKWKSGTNPTADVLSKISDFFNVSMDYLMGLTDEPQKILKVIDINDIDDLDDNIDLTDTVIRITATGTLDQLSKIEDIMKQNGRYYKSEPVLITDKKNLFWDIFSKLCKDNNVTPTTVVKSFDISHGVITRWKNGSLPSADVLIKIADYFGVSVDYLLGKTEEKQVTLEEQPVTGIEKELLELTADMDEDEKMAVLGYAARLVAKHKKED